eukprot:399310_1
MNDTPPSSPEIHSKNKTLESLQQIKNNFAASIDQKMTPISSPIANNTEMNPSYPEPPTSTIISPTQNINNEHIEDINDNDNSQQQPVDYITDNNYSKPIENIHEEKPLQTIENPIETQPEIETETQIQIDNEI